jgi:hypothetical protein
MRRRWIWLTFGSVLLAFIVVSIMVIAGFAKAFSFGSYDQRELQANIAIAVTWGSFGIAGVSYLISRLLAWRKKSSETSPGLREVANIGLAAFFGGLLALAFARGNSWVSAGVSALFFLWCLANGADGSGDDPRRRWARAIGMAAVSLCICLVIVYASG